jgi:tetratricopeptide (TPR) repeat protein
VLKRIAKAQEDVKEQRYEEAAQSYELILRKNLSRDLRVRVLYQLARLYSLNLKKNVAAVECYQWIIDNAHDPTWEITAGEELADLQFSTMKNFKGAVISYGKLASYLPAPQRKDFYEMRIGLAYLEAGECKYAHEVFEKISRSHDNKFKSRSLLEKGRANFCLKEWVKSIADLNQFLQSAPRKEDAVQAKFLVANAYETTENLEEAYRQYHSILDDYPNPEIIRERLGAIQRRKADRNR